MDKKHLLSDFLCDPENQNSLDYDESKKTFKASNEEYPTLGGIPWLISKPNLSIGKWKAKAANLFQYFKDEFLRIEYNLAVNQESLVPSSKRKIATYLDARKKYSQTVEKIISPLLMESQLSEGQVRAIDNSAIDTQNLLGYEANIYRDWGWDHKENQESFDLLKSILPEAYKPESMLSLGAGACKLTYDLHLHFDSATTVACDINPFLLYSAEKMLFSKGLNLYEFPKHPKSTDDIAIVRKMKNSGKIPENFHLVFADAMKPPFRDEAFETILTPWLIDILPQDPRLFFQTINSMLKEGGYWLNFGPLLFNEFAVETCYTFEEIKEIAEACGFEIEAAESKQIQYLDSPSESSSRIETVYAFRAKKVRHLTRKVEVHMIPEWLEDFEKSIPEVKFFKSFEAKHQVYVDVAKQIDGVSSIDKIAADFAEKNGLDLEASKATISQFLLKVFEEAKKGK